MNIKLLAPRLNPEISIETILSNNFLTQRLLSPFADVSIDFFSALSKNILETYEIKLFPELVALAYWLRKANLNSIINDLKRGVSENDILVPRGLAFHIAPSNVDSIFLYSWALSLLAGNLNIVRVTQNLNPQLELLFTIIRRLMIEDKWQEISQRNLIVTYPKEEEINKFISAEADLRVLWGGDETIKSIKILPSKATAIDISFADKFSYTLISCSEYLDLDESGKSNLAKNFYNDSYWFDQMACSSPRFVFFSGYEKKCSEASKHFWNYLQKELIRKGHSDSINIAMEKLVYLYESFSIAENASSTIEVNIGNPTVARVGLDEIRKYSETCGGGFFFECFIESLMDLKIIVNRKDQTLSYFGFSKDLLKEFAYKVNGAGIDRIVPVGQALNFGPTWDGYSLINELTKRVNILS
ncbi:MAG: acyl-CoA reductase [Ignavibacteriaceae bacterium]